jgi:threonine dehydrogenase-like Zn-dependent dehydrogenase
MSRSRWRPSGSRIQGREAVVEILTCGACHTDLHYSDYPTILTSIRERLITLPPDTVVRTGHGENTTIGAERETLAGIPQ